MGTISRTETLTVTQQRELEGILRSERARVERMLADLIADGGGDPFAASIPTSDGGETLSPVQRRRLEGRHEVLTAALRRLETDTYGTCVRCQSPIPFGRLLAMPETDHCVGCSA